MSMAQGYDLPEPPTVPTLGLVSMVSYTYLAQFFQVPSQTDLGHLFPILTCSSEGTHVNGTGTPTVNTALRRRKLTFPSGLVSLEAS